MEMLLEILGSWVLVIGMILLFGCSLKRSNASSNESCLASKQQSSSEFTDQHKPADVELEVHRAP